MFLVILIGVCLTLTCYLFTHQHFVGSGFFGLLTMILSGVSSGISTTNAIWFTITWIIGNTIVVTIVGISHVTARIVRII